MKDKMSKNKKSKNKIIVEKLFEVYIKKLVKEEHKKLKEQQERKYKYSLDADSEYSEHDIELAFSRGKANVGIVTWHGDKYAGEIDGKQYFFRPREKDVLYDFEKLRKYLPKAKFRVVKMKTAK